MRRWTLLRNGWRTSPPADCCEFQQPIERWRPAFERPYKGNLRHDARVGQRSKHDIGDTESLIGGWEASIPIDEKDVWRDPAVREAYVEAALESDETSSQRTLPSFRWPSGALEDSFYQATGRQTWDASQIYSSVLIVVAEHDVWSMPIDRKLLREHLVHAPEVRLAVVLNATRFVHLDRPERGRLQFIDEALRFLTPSRRNDPA